MWNFKILLTQIPITKNLLNIYDTDTESVLSTEDNNNL